MSGIRLRMRSYSALSDHDFELLVADLIGTIEGCRYEAYARGPDLGVDLRRERDDSTVDVVQCKHAQNTSISKLRAAARAEVQKLAKLRPQPATYRFVTSRRLTRRNKRDLMTDLSPYITREHDVWGEDDLEIALPQNPDVERRHIKLWLPSSPQLQAAINSGTYTRTQALVAEILEDVKRWVPTKAFGEAYAMLRKEHVCVIAGVPGIGKTTLAKMLLATALADGYQPVQISGDVEEAWEVYQPNTRQLFYYDDFLGRTALTERLGKNEEDRLLAFMRRAIASPTTLFVLTTREYILQQARQLYEQLAVEGVDDRKILLSLEHYSRLDRARVFYNHAFMSGQLSQKARNDLVKGRAYTRIIDHPSYSPRQIEWITGLSGHKLTASDNEEFLRFALGALNDPGRIWRYGFENQLTDVQRAVLLPLASMPNQVSHDDLQQAFEGFASATELVLRGRTFEKALAVLDDSFLRTYQQDGTLFIAVYNPAVADFLGKYLSESPTDGIGALRGAVFFEQVVGLARLLRAAENAPEALATEFVRALERCFRSPACSWHKVYYGHDATSERTARNRVELEARTSFIGKVRAWGPPYSLEPLRSELGRVHATALSFLQARWATRSGDRSGAVSVLLDAIGRGEDTVALVAAAKTLLKAHLLYPDEFEPVVRLRERVPGAFDDDEWEALGRSYSDVAREALSDWRELRDEDDVTKIERIAEEMGVDLDSKTLAEMRQRLIDRNAKAEDDARADPEEFDVPERADADTSAEIDALFARLAEN